MPATSNAVRIRFFCAWRCAWHPSSEDHAACAAPNEPSSVGTSPLLIFSRIGLTSFGGGLSGWLLREFVQELRLITEEEFLDGLALAQALPGVNVTNMAIWIGYRIRGARGAVAGFCGIIGPPGLLITAIGALLAVLIHNPMARSALTGAAAAAIGLSLSMGLVAANRVSRQAMPLAVTTGCFVAVGPLHLPLIWVALVAAVLSVGDAWVRLGPPRP